MGKPYADDCANMAVPLGAGQAVTRREYLDHAGFVAGSTPPVGGLVYIERRDFVAQLGDSGRAGWLLLERSDGHYRQRHARMLFLTMHSVDGHHRVTQRK